MGGQVPLELSVAERVARVTGPSDVDRVVRQRALPMGAPSKPTSFIVRWPGCGSCGRAMRPSANRRCTYWRLVMTLLFMLLMLMLTLMRC